MRLLLLAIPLTLAACPTPRDDAPAPPIVDDALPDAGTPNPDGDAPTNEDVYTRLLPTCAGCHSADARPFFASLAAFENLIVYDTRYVVPGDPASSSLLVLLRGTGARSMPPDDAFVEQEARGETEITLAELETWIEALQPRDGVVATVQPSFRRKSAELVRSTLMQQLGLSDADFYDDAYEPLADDVYAVRSPDAIPFASSFDQGGTLFGAMGGPDRLSGVWRDDTPTQSFAQALVPVSQAWCRIAFTKSDNASVWLASPPHSAVEAEVRANISALHLKMLGEPATQTDVDDLYANVFVPYASVDAVAQWTAVCAALVRDPLWILY
jgi:hypothetical protein